MKPMTSHFCIAGALMTMQRNNPFHFRTDYSSHCTVPLNGAMSVTNEDEDQVSNDTELLLQNDKLNTTSNHNSDGIILGIWAVVAAAVYAVLWVAQNLLGDGDDDYWLTDLTLNLLGYSTVFLPGYAVIRF